MLKLSLGQQVFTGFAVSILACINRWVVIYKSIDQLENDTVTVDYTQKVIKTTTNCYS